MPLYRKYRPQTLEQLVGQEHVKKTLTNAIELGKAAHAFLFTGPRGTGKTSTARILAKSLNCKNGPTIHPCGECPSCTDIANSVPVDVIEIDAASNRKVEDAQNILEKIQYVPVYGKYKIYIIDEVHMLTNHAFNALLKTLEEPPENVIFILATTEVNKVLDTIKSRCQRFDFRRITTEDIVKHLRYISDEEKINISDEALYSIAKNSAGGMRDSISLLDQLSLLGATKQITSEEVNLILGRVSFEVLNGLCGKIITSNHAEALEILNEIYNSGNEPLQILTNLAEYFKNLLIAKNCRKEFLSELTGLNAEQIKELEKQADVLETQQIVFLIERISYYIREIKLASNQHMWLEVGMIDLANMSENSALMALQNRIKALENGNICAASASVLPVTKPAPEPPKQISEVREEFTPPPVSKKIAADDIQTLWKTLLMNITSTPTKALLALAVPEKITPEETVIVFSKEGFAAQVNNTNKKQMIINAVKTMFNVQDCKVVIKTRGAAVSQAAQTESSQPVSDNISKDRSDISEEKAPAPVETADCREDNASATEQNTPDEEFCEEMMSTQISEKLPRTETDQEKMILELFDGKYVEN